MSFSRIALLGASFFFLILPQAAKASCPERASGIQCKRVQAQLAQWQSEVLGTISIEVVDSIVGSETGFCAYNEEKERVELGTAAFKLEDEAFAQCLGRALSQARYEQIEEKWVSHLGANEAWIIRKGELTKVTVPTEKNGKLTSAMARQVWVSLATQELLTKTRALNVDEGSRTIAATSSNKNPELLRELLGLN